MYKRSLLFFSIILFFCCDGCAMRRFLCKPFFDSDGKGDIEESLEVMKQEKFDREVKYFKSFFENESSKEVGRWHKFIGKLNIFLGKFPEYEEELLSEVVTIFSRKKNIGQGAKVLFFVKTLLAYSDDQTSCDYKFIAKLLERVERLGNK